MGLQKPWSLCTTDTGICFFLWQCACCRHTVDTESDTLHHAVRHAAPCSQTRCTMQSVSDAAPCSHAAPITESDTLHHAVRHAAPCSQIRCTMQSDTLHHAVRHAAPYSQSRCPCSQTRCPCSQSRCPMQSDTLHHAVRHAAHAVSHAAPCSQSRCTMQSDTLHHVVTLHPSLSQTPVLPSWMLLRSTRLHLDFIFLFFQVWYKVPANTLHFILFSNLKQCVKS